MPTQIRPAYRPSGQGMNYEAVKGTLQKSSSLGAGKFRTVESLRTEQSEVSRERATHRVRVRRRHSSNGVEMGFKLSSRGILYAVATVALIVFVKFMINSAGHGGFLDEPERNPDVILGN